MFGLAVMSIISIGVALAVYALIRKSLASLLDDLIKLPAGTAFYLRLLLIGLLFIAFSGSLRSDFDFKTGAAVMEYIWEIAEGLSSVFANICLFTAGYLVLITILLAALRHRHDQ